MRIPRIYLPVDFNNAESLELTEHAFQDTVKVLRMKKIKFGPRILRTETAAISAITAIQLLWGDLLQ